MSDYISRSELIKTVENLQDCYNGFSDTYDKACIIGLIAEQPSVEQKYGEWIAVDPAYCYYKCSECRKGTTFDMKPYNFCPNCGAQMDGDSDV